MDRNLGRNGEVAESELTNVDQNFWPNYNLGLHEVGQTGIERYLTLFLADLVCGRMGIHPKVTRIFGRPGISPNRYLPDPELTSK